MNTEQLKTWLGKAKLPGVAYSALLIAAAAIIQEYVPHNALIYQLAMLLIAGALKGVNLNFEGVVKELVSVELPVPSSVTTRRIDEDPALQAFGITPGESDHYFEHTYTFDHEDGRPVLEGELTIDPEPYWQRLLLG